MTTYERPTNGTEMRAFLGLIRFYRRFIPECSEITHPLNRLTKKDKEYRWDEEEEEAYLTIIKKLTQTPVLKRSE